MIGRGTAACQAKVWASHTVTSSMSSMPLMTSGGRRGSSRHTEKASRLVSFPARKGMPTSCLALMAQLPFIPCLTPLFFPPSRVEKKERARLKTVKFHARTGMIESNRVSVVDQLLPPDGKEAAFIAAAELLGRWPTSPVNVGKRQTPAYWSKSIKQPYYCINYTYCCAAERSLLPPRCTYLRLSEIDVHEVILRPYEIHEIFSRFRLSFKILVGGLFVFYFFTVF